jgi:glucuronosyltransferase
LVVCDAKTFDDTDVYLILLQMVYLAKQLLCLPVLILLQIPEDVLCARFLVIVPTHVKSHFILVEPYLKALVARGHELVVISHFPQKEAVTHYTDIVLKDSQMTPGSGTGGSIEDLGKFKSNPIANAIHTTKFGVHNCETLLSHPSVKELIRSEEKFDVVVSEVFHTDCFLPFAYKFKAINIGISTSVIMPWANDRLGNIDNPSYIPNFYSSYSDHMNFIERVANALTLVIYKMIYRFFSDPPSQQLVRKHFGQDVPDLAELATNTSLLLVNSHFSVNAPRPLVPSAVEIGGLHISKPKPLPQVRQVLMFLTFTNVLLYRVHKKNGADSKVNKKSISHLTRVKRTPSEVATVQVSHVLPAVRFSCLLRGQYPRWRRSRRRLSVCSVLRCPDLRLQCSVSFVHSLELLVAHAHIYNRPKSGS